MDWRQHILLPDVGPVPVALPSPTGMLTGATPELLAEKHLAASARPLLRCDGSGACAGIQHASASVPCLRGTWITAVRSVDASRQRS